MATRPRDSILDLRLSSGGAAVLAALAFLLGYGMRGSESSFDRPSTVTPTEAGLLNMLIWGGMMTLGWAFRDRLREVVMGSVLCPSHMRLPLVVLAFVPVMVADLFSTQLTAVLCPDPACPNQILSIPPLYTFLPRAAVLGTTMLLVLLAWERHLADRSPRQSYAPPLPSEPATVPSNDEWLDFPEAPLLRVRAGDVVLIRSAGNYSEIVAQGRAHLIRATLSELAERLAPMGFVRVHRQTIINMRNVREICRDAAGRALIHLACGNSVPVGRRYMAAIDALTRSGA
jgi:hypothetical protein